MFLVNVKTWPCTWCDDGWEAGAQARPRGRDWRVRCCQGSSPCCGDPRGTWCRWAPGSRRRRADYASWAAPVEACWQPGRPGAPGWGPQRTVCPAPCCCPPSRERSPADMDSVTHFLGNQCGWALLSSKFLFFAGSPDFVPAPPWSPRSLLPPWWGCGSRQIFCLLFVLLCIGERSSPQPGHHTKYLSLLWLTGASRGGRVSLACNHLAPKPPDPLSLSRVTLQNLPAQSHSLSLFQISIHSLSRHNARPSLTLRYGRNIAGDTHCWVWQGLGPTDWLRHQVSPACTVLYCTLLYRARAVCTTLLYLCQESLLGRSLSHHKGVI